MLFHLTLYSRDLRKDFREYDRSIFMQMYDLSIDNRQNSGRTHVNLFVRLFPVDLREIIYF